MKCGGLQPFPRDPNDKDPCMAIQHGGVDVSCKRFIPLTETKERLTQ